MRYMLCPKMLRACMRARHATQSDLARAAGITQPAVRYYLQKPRDPSTQIVLDFAEFLGVEPRALLKKYEGDPAALSISTARKLADGLDLPLGDLR